jgi:thymidine kinase
MSVRIRVGPMFGGKTTNLQEAYGNALVSGKKCLFLIYDKDTRYSMRALNVSHDGRTTIAVRVQNLLQDPPELTEQVNSIFIDEAHFLKGLKEFCIRHYLQGRHIEIAALTSDFRGNPWPYVQELIPAHVTEIKMCPGVCAFCQKEAFCTRKIHMDNQIEDIGGDEKYLPTCHLHLNQPEEVPDEIVEKRRAIIATLRKQRGTDGKFFSE